MNQNQNEKNNQVRNSIIEENQKFKDAIASRDALLKEKDKVIESLQKDLGDRELTISSLISEKDVEKSLRIKAESMVTNEKQLAQTGQEIYGPPKSKEEKFADEYREACQKLKNN
ncbi:protein of unknown function [endosymbiont DhMRE of Dentiscutata heterogama]|uniref:hypothetical protein n=1 Tax=endosymbiont DhMRE of Dentiscutata heterogama TaxID=1609546 RepID=UPI000629D4F1|nr:hypothetical protein [endosymbiont DhMRE of Dentiscutata heterogama]CFW92955.1 protein of unknown function [endosymbiont DhMRE of Dentiscutata heterogama]